MKNFLLLIGVLAAALTACRPFPAHVIPASSTNAIDTAAILASAKPDIDEANAAWLPGLRTRNAQTITAAYADDGLFIAPDGTVTRGRAAITDMYASRFPHMREVLGGDVVQEGLAVAEPDLVFEWGRAWVEIAPEKSGDPPVKRGGKYLTVWHRESDGHWRITRNLAF